MMILSLLSLTAATISAIGQPKALLGTDILIDFGESTNTTGVALQVWNDIHTLNVNVLHSLVDETGAATGIQLAFTATKTFVNAESMGVTSPVQGSALELLGWPASAIGDTLFSEDTRWLTEFTLTGLDPGSTYDFTICASYLGAVDQRTTRYTAFGFNETSVSFDPSNNSTDVVVLRDVAPDGNQEVRIQVRKDPSNTSGDGFFYMGAMGIAENTGAAAGGLIAFSRHRLNFTRVIGQGSFATPLEVDAYDGSLPVVGLSAIDSATGQAPTWLTLAASTSAGSSFSVSVDESALAIGAYTAIITGTAPGYADAQCDVQFSVSDGSGGKNLLFYGNSLTARNRTASSFVRDMAEEAGRASPTVVACLVGGSNLLFHLTDPDQFGAISNSLPLGEEWDWVVLQGQSVEATTAVGDPQAFIANAEAILASVRAHSPGARVCMYQTWAFAPGFSLYPEQFADPLTMHREIESSYRMATDNINAIHGPDVSVRAAAGETAALNGFAASLYEQDLVHPAPILTTMAAASIFGSIYEIRACDQPLDVTSSTSLAARLNSFSIPQALWEDLAGIADRVGTRKLRRYPGSSDDLVLRSSAQGEADACPLVDSDPGGLIQLKLQSPAGTKNQSPWFLYMSLMPSWPTLNPSFPEVYYELANPVIVAMGAELASEGVLIQFPVPVTLRGQLVIVQGFSSASSSQTGRGFTTTDAHLLRIGGGPWSAGRKTGR